jgi:hypothetical protein
MKAKISDEVREAARELRASGLSTRKIAGQLGIGKSTAQRIVSDVKPKKASKPLPKQPLVPETKSALPSSFDKFRELGASVGVEEPLLTAAADFTFRMGADDVKAIYNHLKGIVRIDLAKSWAKLYGGYLGQDLKVEADFGGGDGERFSVIGESIMRDPEGVSHTQALKELETRLKEARLAQPQPKSLLDDVTGLASLVSNLKAAFGGNSQGGTIQLKEGTVSLADFLKIKQFQNDEQSKAKSDETKLGIAKEFRKLLANAGKAMANMSESEEEEEE